MKRFQRRIWVVICAVVLGLLVSACSGGNSQDNGAANASPDHGNAEGRSEDVRDTASITVIDKAGHEVVVPVNPQRIIAPYLEDHLVVLGIEPIAQVLFGNVEQNYLKDQLSGVEIIDTSGVGLPLEKVLDMSPDLILLGLGMAGEGAYEQYEKIAPTYVADNVTVSWRETLLDLAELLDKEQIAAERLDAYDQQVHELKDQLAPTVEGKTAAIVVLSDKEFYTMGHVHGGALLFDELGVKPHHLTPEQDEWNTLSLEKLHELDADFIFVIKTERYQVSELEQSPLWNGLPAVQEGRVFEVDSGIWQYSGMICSERALEDVRKALIE